MTVFNEKKDAVEGQLAHSDKISFAVEARCSKLFGLWAASQIGLEGDEAQAYASTVVEANLEEVGFDDILRKVRTDFDKKGLEVSDNLMQKELEKALAEAHQQIKES